MKTAGFYLQRKFVESIFNGVCVSLLMVA